MKDIRYIWAINEALREEMERDEKVFLIGEDVGNSGGAFGAILRGQESQNLLSVASSGSEKNCS